MENNVIYALHCPVSNRGVYVGKSTSGLIRPFMHIKEKSHNKKVNEWINRLRKDGKEPVLVILENNFSDSQMVDKERYWIQKYLNDGHILLNQVGVNPIFFDTILFDIDNRKTDFLYPIRMFIRARRKLAGLTQKEFADRAGVGLRVLRELEQGKKTNFNTAVIYQMLQMFGRIRLEVVSNDDD